MAIANLNGRRLGAIALIVAGIAAFSTPFLIHSPPLQANTTGGGGTGGGGGETSQPAPARKTMKDLLDSVMGCSTNNHGSQQSLLAKVNSAMRAGHSTRTDQHLMVLMHELDTPAAEKHVDQACLGALKDLAGQLMSSS